MTARALLVAKPGIAANAILEVVDAKILWRGNNRVFRRPAAAEPLDGNKVVVERIVGKTRIQRGLYAGLLFRATPWTGRVDRRANAAYGKDAVDEAEVGHLVPATEDGKEGAGPDGCHMVDLHVMNGNLGGGVLEESASALVILLVNVIGNQIVNTDASAVRCAPAAFAFHCQRGGDHQNPSHITDPDVTHRDIGDAAFGTFTGLADRGEENGKSRLAETTPGVLQQIGFKQDADPALELKIVLDDEWAPR